MIPFVGSRGATQLMAGHSPPFGAGGGTPPKGGGVFFSRGRGVGGEYRIDLHPSTAARVSRHRDLSVPDPAGGGVPQRLDNLLAAGKCLGVTHITNGCYRLHPVEWNVGEVAGALAAFCLEHRVSPRSVRNTPYLLADFQRSLISTGVQLHWPEEIQTMVR